MRRLMMTVLALALAAGAQESPKWQQRVFDVKFADPQALAGLVRSSCQNRETRVVENANLKAISVGTFNEADMRTAEELIKRYDVPSGPAPAGNRNVELTAYLLLAAPKGESGEAVPADLDVVVRQIRNAFGYKDYRMLDSTVIRTREGTQVDTSGNVGALLPGAFPSRYQMNYRNAAVSATEHGNLIRLDGFKFGMNVPVQVGLAKDDRPQFQFSDIGFYTNLDIREGQKVVVGKTKSGDTGGAFILVLTAKAVD
ncbi:MAG: hypothetical protein HZB13_10275 [Acidobacteria bacterium]|nr:hypothetical protein [Acidobacteriota bacterium]